MLHSKITYFYFCGPFTSWKVTIPFHQLLDMSRKACHYAKGGIDNECQCSLGGKRERGCPNPEAHKDSDTLAGRIFTLNVKPCNDYTKQVRLHFRSQMIDDNADDDLRNRFTAVTLYIVGRDVKKKPTEKLRDQIKKAFAKHGLDFKALRPQCSRYVLFNKVYQLYVDTDTHRYHRHCKHTTRCLAYWCRDDLKSVPLPDLTDEFGTAIKNCLLSSGVLNERFTSAIHVCGCHVLQADAEDLENCLPNQWKPKDPLTVRLYTCGQLRQRRLLMPLSPVESAARTRSGGMKRTNQALYVEQVAANYELQIVLHKQEEERMPKKLKPTIGTPQFPGIFISLLSDSDRILRMQF